jgi:hypothetical protein
MAPIAPPRGLADLVKGAYRGTKTPVLALLARDPRVWLPWPLAATDNSG